MFNMRRVLAGMTSVIGINVVTSTDIHDKSAQHFDFGLFPVAYAWSSTSEENVYFPTSIVGQGGLRPPLPTLTSSLSIYDQTLYLDDILPYGLPSVENVVIRRPYISSTNFRTKCPNWVAEHYVNTGNGKLDKVAFSILPTRESNDNDVYRAADKGKVSRKGIQFCTDAALPRPFRALPSDYLNTGYGRGHLATAASHNNDELDLLETFLLSSNIVPQNHLMNEGDWAKLERLSRAFTSQFAHVRSVTGPLYLPMIQDGRYKVEYEVMGKNQVHVPTHLFKVLYLEQPIKGKQDSERSALLKMASRFNIPYVSTKTTMKSSNGESIQVTKPGDGRSNVIVLAFAMPNNPESNDSPLSSYVVPLQVIEKSAGLCLTPRTSPHSITMTTTIKD